MWTIVNTVLLQDLAVMDKLVLCVRSEGDIKKKQASGQIQHGNLRINYVETDHVAICRVMELTWKWQVEEIQGAWFIQSQVDW